METEAPSAIRLWATMGGNENQFYESMTNARACCKEPRLLAIQFKILNNIWPTGEKLATWKLRLDNLCFCNTKDTIVHALHDCVDTQSFLRATLQYLDKNQTFCNNVTTVKVIFGVDDQAWNYILLLIKWFILTRRIKLRKLNFESFKKELFQRLIAEKRTIKHSKFLEKWREFQWLIDESDNYMSRYA